MGNIVNGFVVLLEEETVKINGGDLGTALAEAAGGAFTGGLIGFGVGKVVTPVTGPYGIPVCTGIGIVGGACEGFVQEW